jgi:PAS domain S-box-containing protein
MNERMALRAAPLPARDCGENGELDGDQRDGRPSEREGEIAGLVARLAQAEAAVAAAMAGQVDSIVDPSGQSYLLREAQQALLQSEARAKEHAALLDAVVRSATDFIAFIDREGILRWLNRLPAHLADEEVVGAHWLTFSAADDRAGLQRIFASVIASGEPAHHEGSARFGGEAPSWLSRRFSPVLRDGTVVGVVVVTRDYTEAKEAEDRLVVSDRMASLGMLAAGVAHEINNPLAAVMANLHLASAELDRLVEQTRLPANLLAEVADARTGADRVHTIVQDLKLFSRAEPDRAEPVNVESVMESTLRMAWNEVRHRARVIRDYKPCPPVLASESRLGQVFLNLVVNAAQAIPEGNVAANRIRVATSTDATGRVVVTVSDSGSGIAPDIQTRLFTPFLTTKAAGGGTGLGLAICQRIVTALGGEISFTTEEASGTEFRLVLPAAAPDQVSPPVGSPAPGPAPRRGKVLVIDDDAIIARATERILAAEHEVVTVDSGARALELLREGQRFDAILCDLMMPQTTGMDIYEELFRTNPVQAARILFTTGGAFTMRARDFLARVPNKHLEKPFDYQNLRALVNDIVMT